jgi:hypothetical protein
MATKKKTTARPPRFKKGDRVSFLFGADRLEGMMVEDRGPIGVGCRRLYSVEFEINPGEIRYIELPEEDLSVAG